MPHQQIAFLVVALAATTVLSAPRMSIPPCPAGKAPRLWDQYELFRVPRMTPATDHPFNFEFDENVRPVYLEGLPFQGKPTFFFAWVGLPKGLRPGQKVPGVVLVHGGGGTAFAPWVEWWIRRGYAAIAMDTVGRRPVARQGFRTASVPLDGAPPAWYHYENDIARPRDSWTAHAVGTIVRAHSYLRSLPEVVGPSTV